MSLAFEIRDAEPADAAEVCAFAWRVFSQTFIEDLGCVYPPADLEHFRRESYSPELFAYWAGSPDYALTVAEADGALIGYALAGPCSFDHPLARPEYGELKRLYIGREGHGRGIAPVLLARSLEHLRALRRTPVLLSVWSGNRRAQAFYEKHGFEKIAEFKFPVGETLDDEHLMRLG